MSADKSERAVELIAALEAGTIGVDLASGRDWTVKAVWELAEKIPAFAASDKPAALQFVNRLHAAGVLTIPAGNQIVRLLPPLNLKPQEAAEGISKIEEVVKLLV